MDYERMDENLIFSRLRSRLVHIPDQLQYSTFCVTQNTWHILGTWERPFVQSTSKDVSKDQDPLRTL
jgi:hypothetical protein